MPDRRQRQQQPNRKNRGVSTGTTPALLAGKPVSGARCLYISTLKQIDKQKREARKIDRRQRMEARAFRFGFPQGLEAS